MEVKPSQIDRFIGAPPEGLIAALVFGPDQGVVHWIGGSLTLGELRDAAHGLARLLARYGVAAREPVACVVNDGTTALIAMFATWLAGGVLYSLAYLIVGWLLRDYPHLMVWFRITALLAAPVSGIVVIVRRRQEWTGCHWLFWATPCSDRSQRRTAFWSSGSIPGVYWRAHATISGPGR